MNINEMSNTCISEKLSDTQRNSHNEKIYLQCIKVIRYVTQIYKIIDVLIPIDTYDTI